MPQMAPLWWSSLYIMFLTAFILMIIMLYFSMSTEPMNKMETIKSKLELNWKW